MMMRSRVLQAAVLAAGVVTTREARADWPMARHDAQRTGAAAGASNLTHPVAYWRSYLGGAIGDRGVMGLDVQEAGRVEIVFTGGGRLAARTADDAELWKTPLIYIDTLDAATDVNGDGSVDIIGHSSNRVYVVDAQSGQIEWAEPAGEMGTIGGVRVADLDGDGRDDVYVQECGSCPVNSGKTGFAYSFGSGFSAVKVLWTAPFVTGGGGNVLTVVDVDGDTHPEVTLGSKTAITILDGATGAVLATSPVLGTSIQVSQCVPANIDGAIGEELVCGFNASSVADDSGHRLFVLHYAASPSPSVSVVWQQNVGQINGVATWGPGMVSDLDGDGALEVIASGGNSGGDAETYVFDAATGLPLATLPDEKIAGTANLMAANESVILTNRGSTLSAWSFSRVNAPSFTHLWSLPEHDALSSPDWTLVRRTSISNALVATDLSGDGLDDIVVRTLASSPQELELVESAGGSPVVLGRYKFSAGVEPLGAWVVPPVNRAYDQVLTAGSDGFISILDDKFVATVTPGMRFGGFYARGSWRFLDSEPVVASLGSGPGQAILVTDSRGALDRLDGNGASFAVPPGKVWESGKTTGPIVLPGLDASRPGIACWKLQQPVTNPQNNQIAALRADGSPIWIVPVAERPLGGLVAGHLNSDSVPDLFVQWGQSTDTILHLQGISGASGATLWTQSVIAGVNRAPAGASVMDTDGDGFDDLYYVFSGLRVASGKDGHQIGVETNTSLPYALPTIYDVNGDGKAEVTLSGTLGPARTLDADFTTTLWQGPNNQPFPYGAIAACPGKPPRLAEGSYAHPAQLDVTDTSGVSAGSALHVVLAGGKSYPDEASATADGAQLGQLTSASVHNDLTGTGRPSVAVGSNDGWLYAVDPCTATLDFSVDFGAPVGAVAFGDTDGDGLDELLVSVADGYLYDLRQPPLEAPSFVLDTDPDHGITDTDVDDIVTTDKLSGRWSASVGATGYRVAVAMADGSGYVTSPPWRDVGNATSTSLTGLPLSDGMRYTFAVKALKGPSASPDTLSNGVTVHFPGDAGVDAAPDAVVDAESDVHSDAMSESGPDTALDAADEGLAVPPTTTIEGGGCACDMLGRLDPSGSTWLIAISLLGTAGLVRWPRRGRRRPGR